MPGSQRLAIWCLALLLSLLLYYKGRVPTQKGEGAAFSRSGAETVTVRLAGDFPRPGIYSLPKGTAPLTAIKMTVPGTDPFKSVRGPVNRELESGDILTLKLAGSVSPVISITKMGARERMLLKIPLHPDLMTEEDWDLLPGIGPALSRRIVEDRQENGAFGSVEGLLRVPGIGPGKLSEIRRHF